MNRLRAIGTLLALYACDAPAQTLRVMHDERAEVIGILFRVAGARDFSDGALRQYNRDIDSTFAPFKDHPVFVEINRLRKQRGLSLSSVTTMVPQIKDVVSFAERSPIDAPSSTLSGSWGGADARPFLSAARDFARVALLARFLREHKSLYDTATVRLRHLLNTAHPEWFNKYFGGPARDEFIVTPMLGNANGNFGTEFTNGGTHERYAIVGVPLEDAKGNPTLAPDVLPMVVHEFNHSYVNRIVGARSADLRAAGEQIYRGVQSQMRALAYGSWPTMLNESVVRASVIRYLLANEGKVAAEHEMSLQRGQGFVWMNELVDLLGEYETQRRQYPTLESFMPRIVAYYDALVPRLDKVIADFEQRRPTVVSASIADSAQDVDPALNQLVVRFSSAVDPIITLVGNFGAGVPLLTSVAFDAAHTTMTLGIKVEPGREYTLPLGPGALVGRDGYPLRMHVVRFRTKAAPKPN